MTPSSQAFEALDQIQREIDARETQVGTASTAELCKTYRAIKPLLLAVLPWIDRLLNKTVGDAIRFLMKIADGLCPA